MNTTIIFALASALAIALGAGLLFIERGRFLRGSTWRLLRAGGWQKLRDKTFFHSYLYARFTKEYIGYALKNALPKLSPRARHSVADHYHGKVLPLALAEAIVTHDHDTALHDLEQVIPYPVARNLVLNGSPEVAVFDCPCRTAREHHCEPLQVCMIVGQPFVDFIVEHHPQTARRVTTNQAIEILRAEHARGHVHTAYFKDAMLDRFYAICNCCKCCCGGIEAMMKHHVPMLASSGYVARVNEILCAGCGTCADACAFDAIQLNGHSNVIWEKCMGCGVCEGQCPNDAIELARDEHKGVPLDVRAL
ncbi:MAG: 4Fe-4S binding protein [Chloroflexi bacterium]|nr:4Fe-4S binding protein [Chloroflexota bacterium]